MLIQTEASAFAEGIRLALTFSLPFAEHVPVSQNSKPGYPRKSGRNLSKYLTPSGGDLENNMSYTDSFHDNEKVDCDLSLKKVSVVELNSDGEERNPQSGDDLAVNDSKNVCDVITIRRMMRDNDALDQDASTNSCIQSESNSICENDEIDQGVAVALSNIKEDALTDLPKFNESPISSTCPVNESTSNIKSDTCISNLNTTANSHNQSAYENSECSPMHENIEESYIHSETSEVISAETAEKDSENIGSLVDFEAIDSSMADLSFDDEGKVKECIKHWCSILLPQTLAGNCAAFFHEYSDSLLVLIAQEIDPSGMCFKAGMCKTNATIPQLMTNVAAPDLGHFLIDECSVCTTVVDYMDKLLEEDDVDKEITHLVEKVCAVVPASYRDKCSSILEAYGPYILQMIGQVANSKQLCQDVDLCPRTAGHIHLIGGAKCTFGSSYWCHSAAHAAACKDKHIAEVRKQMEEQTESLREKSIKKLEVAQVKRESMLKEIQEKMKEHERHIEEVRQKAMSVSNDENCKENLSG